MWISHRKEIRKLTFRAFESLYGGYHIINPVDKTQLSRYTSHRRSTTVSLETYLSTSWLVRLYDLYSLVVKNRELFRSKTRLFVCDSS